MSRTALVVLLVIVSGCTSTYTQSELARPAVKLERDKRIVVALPADGSYDGKEYSGSGRSTATAVRAAFAKFSREATIVPECQTVSCLIGKVGASADYLVVPEILRWEDRATEWSGIKDKLELKLAIYEGRSGKELAAASLFGKSKWLTFGGDHPQDLLPEPIDSYLATLF